MSIDDIAQAAVFTNDRPELAQGRILSVFDYTTTWPYWERHPTGDELVYVLSGDVELHLGDGHQRRTVTLEVGEAVVIAAGTWHRSLIHAPRRRTGSPSSDVVRRDVIRATLVKDAEGAR